MQWILKAIYLPKIRRCYRINDGWSCCALPPPSRPSQCAAVEEVSSLLFSISTQNIVKTSFNLVCFRIFHDPILVSGMCLFRKQVTQLPIGWQLACIAPHSLTEVELENAISETTGNQVNINIELDVFFCIPMWIKTSKIACEIWNLYWKYWLWISSCVVISSRHKMNDFICWETSTTVWHRAIHISPLLMP